MKLLIALSMSLLLHAGWIFLWPAQINVKANVTHVLAPLKLHLANNSAIANMPIAVAAKTTFSQKVAISNKKNHQDLMNSDANLIQNVPASAQQNVQDAYLSIKEVDIQALPINNIDASMLPATMQNTQIKLRLFIDEFGKIARIEPIKSQLYQDETLETALSEQLTKVRFTPAKRNGLDVKSYQEVAYDFNFYQASNHP